MRLSAGEINSHPWLTVVKLNKNQESSLNGNVIDMMRSYNAERRLRKAVHTVVAFRRFILGGICYHVSHAVSPTAGRDESAKVVQITQAVKRIIKKDDVVIKTIGAAGAKSATAKLKVVGKTNSKEVIAPKIISTGRAGRAK